MKGLAAAVKHLSSTVQVYARKSFILLEKIYPESLQRLLTDDLVFICRRLGAKK